jgi:hypothetical protein
MKNKNTTITKIVISKEKAKELRKLLETAIDIMADGKEVTSFENVSWSKDLVCEILGVKCDLELALS